MYYLLTESFKDQEKKLVEIINTCVPVDRIYMLGSTLIRNRTETVFKDSMPTASRVGHYYLLVIISGNDNSSNYYQDKIENNCLSFIPVTAITFLNDDFNNLINAGNFFVHLVLEKAVCLHGQKQPVSSFHIEKQNSLPIISAETQARYNMLINEFLAAAELFNMRKQYSMSVLMLHQATEHALHKILKQTTGLHVNTHNLDKLLRYCTMVNYKIPDIFPRNNQRNEKIFQTMQRSYIDTRYKEPSKINDADLQILINRVKHLKVIAENE